MTMKTTTKLEDALKYFWKPEENLMKKLRSAQKAYTRERSKLREKWSDRIQQFRNEHGAQALTPEIKTEITQEDTRKLRVKYERVVEKIMSAYRRK